MRTYSYSIAIIGHKKNENAFIDSIKIPDFDIAFPVDDLSLEQKTKLNEDGFRHFLKHEALIKDNIIERLTEVDHHDIHFKPLTEEEIIEQDLLKPHDRIEWMAYTLDSTYRTNYCETILPRLIKFTLATEYLFFLPLLTTAISRSDNDAFSTPEDFGETLGLTQAVQYILYKLSMNLATAGVDNLAVFGSVFDSFFHATWRFLTCQKKSAEEASREPVCYFNRLARVIGKSMTTIFFCCYVLSDFLLDLQQFKSMKNYLPKISPFSIFPQSVTSVSMDGNFYFNQLNDTMLSASYLCWAYKKIDEQFPLQKKIMGCDNNNAGSDIEAGINDVPAPSSKWCCLFRKKSERREPPSSPSVYCRLG